MYTGKSTMSMIQIPFKDKVSTYVKKFKKLDKKDASLSSFGKMNELPLQYSKPLLDFF